ncbi:hypothetical protein EJB05_10959, partial [Eragrostis curvula]
MKMANKLAVAIALLALLGPVSCQGLFTICFNGWLRLPAISLGFVACPRGSSTDPSTSPSPAPPSGLGLSYGYYNNSSSDSYCPQAESLVKEAVAAAIAKDERAGAWLIRLFFHDCFVRGCDASVLLTTTESGNTDTEREGPPNKNSLRGFEVIDTAKAKVEAQCEGKVSCADILAFAARDAAYILSNRGINIPTPAGRRDGRVSLASETDQLPGPFSTFPQLVASFLRKGLTSDEMVTLSGAHTIGNARCAFFSHRFSSMDRDFAAKIKCNTNETRVDQDYQTPYALDNKYYQNVLAKKVLFDSDDALKTVPEVKQNAYDPKIWETKFEKAMENLGKIIDVESRAKGETRKICSRVNGY